MKTVSTHSTPPDIPVAPTASPSIEEAPDHVDGGSTDDVRAVDFDDDEIYSGRGNGAASGGTTAARGGDSGKLAPPAEELSRSNEPRERTQSPDTRAR